MQRVPLAPLSVLNHVNPLFQNLPLSHKLSSTSRGNTCSDLNLSKTDLESSDNTTSFHDRQAVSGSVFDRIELDMDSPIQSPRSKTSSIQKKSIKKDKTVKKYKTWMKLRERKATKGSKTGTGITRESSENMTYDVTPRKFLSELLCEEEEVNEKIVEEKEVKKSSSKNLATGCSKANSMIDKNIYCLNWIPKNVTKLQVSGISVFFEDEEDSYAFPASMRTVKFVV